MRKTQLFLPLLCLALLLSACGGNGGEAASSPPPADTEDVSPAPTPEPTPEPPEETEAPEPGRVMDPEDVKRLEGSWECIGMVLNDDLVFFSEYPEVAQLYDQILLIRGDGTYDYLDAPLHRGIWDPMHAMPVGDFEYFYLFSRQCYVSFVTDENGKGSIQEEESPGSYFAGMWEKHPDYLVWMENMGGEGEPTLFLYQRDEDESSGWSGAAPSATATTGERNALEKARDYLDFMAFSYSGLVEQLEFEGFLHSEAVYGADNCGADWYEQAALKAAEYLDFMPFSRSGLIEQLEYEGFTHAQAVYGVEQNGY